MLKDINLNIKEGEFISIMGPSGSGKTTLLSILGGFLAPSKGRIFINGVDCTTMAPSKRPTATVFQDYALFPHMTIANNVGFGLRMRGLPQAKRAPRVIDMLKLVGLEQSGSPLHQLAIVC